MQKTNHTIIGYMHLYFKTSAVKNENHAPISFYTELSFDFTKCPTESILNHLKTQVHEIQKQTHPDCHAMETVFIEKQQYHAESDDMSQMKMNLPI